MKKILLFLFLILTTFAGRGQNLVPNGDFEAHTNCAGSIGSAISWINPTASSPDYLNQCGNNVPTNPFGYQQAHSGVAYSGLALYGDNDFREYIEVPLTSALMANSCYHFELYFALGEIYSKYTTDDIGVYFSDTVISGVTNNLNLPYIAQLNNITGNYPDTSNWTLVSGNYTAAGGENYLIIGNFKNNANTDTVLYNSSISWTYAYVYIDDVSLTTPCTGIEEQNQNEAIKIYPNPAKDFINISFTLKEEKNVRVEVYDLFGRKVFEKELQTSNTKLQTQIDMRSFSDGIYIVEINSGEGIYRKKVLKE